MFPEDAEPMHLGTGRVPCPVCGALLAFEIFGVQSGATAEELTVELSADLSAAKRHVCEHVPEPAVEAPAEPAPTVPVDSLASATNLEPPASDQTGSTS